MEAATAKAVGTAFGMAGDLVQGSADKSAANFEAAQMVRNAKARYAQGTRDTQEALRQGRVLQSNARAAMAAGGGVTTDPGAIEQLAKLKDVTDYNALSQLFQAKTEFGAGMTQAAARRMEGSRAKKNSIISALSKASTLIPVK